MKNFSKTILPFGFKANGISAGLKKSGKLDLALLYSEYPAVASAKFTTNSIIAAPLIVSQGHLKSGKFFQAVIINSGNANCFTGESGIKAARLMSSAAVKNLGLKTKGIFVASTGIIGKKLPVEKIIRAIPELKKGLSAGGIKKFSQGILTTDKFKKEITVKINIQGKQITVSSVAKGAGMISPHMATMLCFITSDINIEKACLKEALKSAVADSFNSISVDGCQSTNDTVFILANGLAGNKILNKVSREYPKFLQALKFVCLELAKLIVKDGEGSSKIIQLEINGAKTEEEAKRVGFIIANSNLFKTAMYGADPNFGRIVQAVGTSGLDIKEKDLKITFSPLEKKEVKIKVSLGRGKKSGTVYTSDLTPEYIRVNSKYN